jgi:hypothetical protein
MNWRKVEYKIAVTVRDTFQVYKQTSYFRISWTMEHIGSEFYDLSSARSFIKMIVNKEEIKYL